MSSGAPPAPEAAPLAPPAAAQPPAALPTPPAELVWEGPPSGRQEDGALLYRAFRSAGARYALGDHVYMQPAEAGAPLYIARLDALLQAPLGAPPPEAASPQGMYAEVAWFYRPQELELDAPLLVAANEVFATEESAAHPLESVAGACAVYPATDSALLAGAADAYVCARRYVPSEGRVVPLEGAAGAGGDALERPLALVGGRLAPAPRPPTAQRARAPPPARARPPSKRKRRERGRFSPEPPGGGGGGGGGGAAAAAAAASGSSGEEAAGGEPEYMPQRGAGAAGAAAAPALPRLRREGAKGAHGRWSAERYAAAQRALVHVLRLMGAAAPDAAVLRPRLRDEARKVIGDTGLLDHLLKHLTDEVAAPTGERLRRRHNREGHMQYWLQSPAAAAAEEEQLCAEVGALSAELAEVREARAVLARVRDEAAQAIQAVSGLKERPEDAGGAAAAAAAAAGLGPRFAAGGDGGAGAGELEPRLAALEAAVTALARRVRDAEALAAAGLEGVRAEVGETGRPVAARLGAAASEAGAAGAVAATATAAAAAVDVAARGRFEALAAALGPVTSLRRELAARDGAMAALAAELAALRGALEAAGVRAGAAGGAPSAPQVSGGGGGAAPCAGRPLAQGLGGLVTPTAAGAGPGAAGGAAGRGGS